MSIVEIKLNNKSFQLACSQDSSKQLLDLASELDVKIQEIKEHSPSASSELLLVMTALSLQDQVNSLNEKMKNLSNSTEDRGDNSAEMLANISEYLENLAKKVKG